MLKYSVFFFWGGECGEGGVGGGGGGKGGGGRVVLPANDYGTSELCYFYTTYS